MSKRCKWDSDSEEDNAVRKKEKREKKEKDKEKVKKKFVIVAPSPPKPSNTAAEVDQLPHPHEDGGSGDSLKPPCRSVDVFERLNFIDQGTYGMVFRARCKDSNKVYALKQVKLPADAAKNGFPITAFREINILLSLKHDNILRVYEMVIGSTVDKVYMVMEYYENDLKAVMKMNRQSFSTAEIKRLVIQLLDGLRYMHGRWIIHRDLKSSNLLYRYFIIEYD